MTFVTKYCVVVSDALKPVVMSFTYVSSTVTHTVFLQLFCSVNRLDLEGRNTKKQRQGTSAGMYKQLGGLGMVRQVP